MWMYVFLGGGFGGYTIQPATYLHDQDIEQVYCRSLKSHSLFLSIKKKKQNGAIVFCFVTCLVRVTMDHTHLLHVNKIMVLHH